MKKCKSGYYWCYTDKVQKNSIGRHVGRGGIIEKDEEEKNGDNKNALEMGMGGLMGGLMAGVSEEQSLKTNKDSSEWSVQSKRKSKHRRRCSEKLLSMKKKDVKDFASTKHKGLPEKKKVEETYYGGEEQRKKDEKKHTKNN